MRNHHIKSFICMKLSKDWIHSVYCSVIFVGGRSAKPRPTNFEAIANEMAAIAAEANA
jgi:hypothetical protein